MTNIARMLAAFKARPDKRQTFVEWVADLWVSRETAAQVAFDRGALQFASPRKAA